MARVLTSIATVSLSGALEEKLQAVARAGFDGVEIFENDLLAFPGSPAEVGADHPRPRACSARCSSRFGISRACRPSFDRAPSIVPRRSSRSCSELGTDLLLVCSSVSAAASSDRSRIVDDFRELGERAAAHGVRVGYEALAWGRHVWDHRQAWEIVRQVDHPAIGLILDSFHSLVRRIPIGIPSGDRSRRRSSSCRSPTRRG